jgi:hypothetical protein
MKIKLQSGKEVYVEAFHCTPTYAGLLVGTPTKESNEVLLQQISSPVEWGQRKTLLKKSDLYVSKDVLKPIVYSVWLSSSESINNQGNEFDGSDVILIWLEDENIDMTIKDNVEFGIGLLDWDNHAENFQF